MFDKKQYYYKYIAGIFFNKHKRKISSHDSERLNKLLYKKVEITFFNDSIKVGYLEKEPLTDRYLLNGEEKISFYKTNVKKIKDVSVIHVIKLQREYAYSKLQGIKPFEIRLNDRNYKVGDFVQYTILEDVDLNNIFKERLYKIEYITHYQQKDGYIVFTDNLVRIDKK